MSQDNPILNRPYKEPQLHYRTLSGPQGSLLDQQNFQESLENHLINLVRKEVNAWRNSNYETPAPERYKKTLNALKCMNGIFWKLPVK
jgi:hypothetical protein